MAYEGNPIKMDDFGVPLFWETPIGSLLCYPQQRAHFVVPSAQNLPGATNDLGEFSLEEADTLWCVERHLFMRLVFKPPKR